MESSKQFELKNNLVTQHSLMEHSEMSDITVEEKLLGKVQMSINGLLQL